MDNFDLVIRGGTIFDGTGGESRAGDVAIQDGRIAAMGRVAGKGKEEIDALDRLVTPGWVDIHTHYDGQVTWSNRLNPSSTQGATTIVMGNCGVGFAPCLPERRETLIKVMEGVEDIPGIVLEEGIPWTWQSFPEYLDVLGRTSYDIDIAAQMTHAPVRVHVMGERGVNRERATDEDIAKMARLVQEGVQAGALGFSTSRTLIHRLKDGSMTPTIHADERELMGIALGMKAAGAGVLEMVEDSRGNDQDLEIEYGMWRRIVQASGRPLSFTLSQFASNPLKHREVLAFVEKANQSGLKMRGQTGNRPVGMILGLECSLHPFAGCSSFAPLAGLPLAQKVAAMKRPEMRARLLAEAPPANDQNTARVRGFDSIYPFGEPPNYFPGADRKLSVLAAQRGIAPLELAYEILLSNDGHGQMYYPGTNFYNNSNDELFGMITHPQVLMGLGDGGAHMMSVCDASMPTHLLSYWTRDRANGERIPLARAVHMLTKKNADYIGLKDRGVLAPGYRADVNVIDYNGLRIHAPVAVSDLPAGGSRLDQRVDGYDATIAKGQVIYRAGRHTGALPGRLIRGAQPAPR